MAGIIESRLTKMGLKLPEVASPQVAKILNWKKSDNLLFVSGQVPRVNGQISWLGKLGREFTLAQGQEAARDSALMVLACTKEALGDLDRVKEVVRLKGYINVEPDFIDISSCLNGASELFIELFGDAGRHARTAIGVASMPFGVAIEVEGVFEVF
ncbi:MAG: RidA family protein [Pseudomonadota bacterium]|nr:RidA family protein [Pseudomonadota bacterium]